MSDVSAESVDDLLSAVLSTCNVKVCVHATPPPCGDPCFDGFGQGKASFHLIGDGGGCLHMRGAAPIRVEPGDFVVLPHDDWHLLVRGEASPDSAREMNGHGSSRTFISGYFEFDARRRNPVLTALPSLILIPCSDTSRRLECLFKVMLMEIEEGESGSRPVLDRLADALFVMVVRHYVLASEVHKRGIIAALSDTRLGAALSAMHQNPGEHWTLDRLACAASMSRSAFATRFAEVVGETPIDYLTRWRMVIAERMLRDPRETVSSVIDHVGYRTEAAFRKAFKRVHGYAPGRVRRRMRDLSSCRSEPGAELGR